MVNLVCQLRLKPTSGERLSLAVIAAESNVRAEEDLALQPRTAAKWHPTKVKRILTRA